MGRSAVRSFIPESRSGANRYNVRKGATAMKPTKTTGVQKNAATPGASKINRQTYQLPDDLAAAVRASLEDWRAHDKARKLWARDASLWTGADEGQWLGWL